MSLATMFLTGDPERGTKEQHVAQNIEIAVMSREGYFKVTWSSKCLTKFEQIIDASNKLPLSLCLL